MSRLLPLMTAGLLATATATGRAAAAPAEEADARPWRAAATLYGYAVPDAPDFLMVVAPIALRWLHLEGRYNYEALHTGSAFAGVDAGWGQKLRLRLTPMVGAVFGELDGVAPALRITLAWWRLDFYSEAEVVIALDDVGETFVYSWSELGLSLLKWLRVGIVVQRLRVLETPLSLQRGLFVGGTFRFLNVTLYELNAGWTTPTFVAALGVSF